MEAPKEPPGYICSVQICIVEQELCFVTADMNGDCDIVELMSK